VKAKLLLIAPYPDWTLDALDANYDVIRLWEATDRDSAIRAIATRRESGASSELMHELPKLEIVVCYGVGRDAIDLAYAKARGVRATNTPDVFTADVHRSSVQVSRQLRFNRTTHPVPRKRGG
jgi:lactate dehydrogenase-like 2-hydroxyacid dehydrogenase